MKTEQQLMPGASKMARRSFLKHAGAGIATAGVLTASACHKDHNTFNGIDIGSGDTGILNFAYALEQLEAAFYTQVIKTPYSNMPSAELTGLTSIRDHEILHREFFKAALKGSAIQTLTPNFSTIDFTSRTSVLGAAKAFEDLGVMAYDGAGYLIKNPDYLTIAGKIVSVEARHAAYIRDLIAPATFEDSNIVDFSTGQNKSLPIAKVLPMANVYLTTKVSAINFGYIA